MFLSGVFFRDFTAIFLQTLFAIIRMIMILNVLCSHILTGVSTKVHLRNGPFRSSGRKAFSITLGVITYLPGHPTRYGGLLSVDREIQRRVENREGTVAVFTSQI